MSKKNEVVKQESTEVAVHNPEMGFGAADGISQKDIKIDRIMLTQSMSKKVQEDEISKGVLCIQSTLEVLASIKDKTSMEFIPLKAMKYWIEQDKDTKEFISRKPANSPDDYPWEEQIGARTVKRTYTHSFIVLLPSKIASMEETPLELAFRSTNLDCARAINTILLNMKRKNVPSWAKVFSLKIDTKTKGQNTWYVTVPSLTRDVTADEKVSVEQWAKILNDAQVNLADENDSAPAETYAEESDY
jgi:hypothetical protein